MTTGFVVLPPSDRRWCRTCCSTRQHLPALAVHRLFSVVPPFFCGSSLFPWFIPFLWFILDSMVHPWFGGSSLIPWFIPFLWFILDSMAHPFLWFPDSMVHPFSVVGLHGHIITISQKLISWLRGSHVLTSAHESAVGPKQCMASGSWRDDATIAKKACHLACD